MSPAPYRILQLASSSDMGGTERMILFLTEALDRAKFTPYVGALVGDGDLIRRSAPHCQQARHFEFRFPGDPIALKNLVSFIRENRIDLVQTYGLRADTAGRIAAKLGGAKVIVSSIRSIDPWRRWHHTLLDKATASLVDMIISNSAAGRDAAIARREYPPEKIKVVYSGIPTRSIPRERRTRIRQELGLAPDAFPVIGILANLREMKGHEDVIEALPALRAGLPKLSFLFAGRDDSMGDIESLARTTGVADSIKFMGYVEDTTPLLAAMDFFMLPSHWEGLPVSVIEAMHAALPIITTRVGGIPELIRDRVDGLLIEPANPIAITNAVFELAQDTTLRHALATSARERAMREFSVTAMTSKIEAIYGELLEK
ncbi:MAG: glycosyltransferase [Candidatus Sumerlaeaceae bacterium]|nr:glycosyltransferase [Candidatus Sumerlaeaceae bacterium]